MLEGASAGKNRTSDGERMSKPIAIFLALVLVACAIPARAQSLDVQEKCASDARQAFQQREDAHKANQEQSAPPEKSVSDYQSHYSRTLKRCLMLISRKSFLPQSTNLSDQQRQWMLVDANERRVYAVYSETQLATETKAKLERCELSPNLRMKTGCTTRGEFDAFVARYLEQ